MAFQQLSLFPMPQLVDGIEVTVDGYTGNILLHDKLLAEEYGDE